MHPPPQADVVDFANRSLEPEAEGIASRAIEVNAVRWALVEYKAGTLRQEWCHEGHSGYVVEGDITYEFDDGAAPIRASAGQGFRLPEGQGHRGRAGPAGARLFLIDRAA
jgi:quercetin dioxygenase-like cupin family protein